MSVVLLCFSLFYSYYRYTDIQTDRSIKTVKLRSNAINIGTSWKKYMYLLVICIHIAYSRYYFYRSICECVPHWNLFVIFNEQFCYYWSTVESHFYDYVNFVVLKIEVMFWLNNWKSLYEQLLLYGVRIHSFKLEILYQSELDSNLPCTATIFIG